MYEPFLIIIGFFVLFGNDDVCLFISWNRSYHSETASIKPHEYYVNVYFSCYKASLRKLKVRIVETLITAIYAAYQMFHQS